MFKSVIGAATVFKGRFRKSQENSRRPNSPWRKNRITRSRARESSTIRSPGMPGRLRPQSWIGSSTTRSHSPARVKKAAATTAPVVDPNPPTTMMISRLKVRKKVKSDGEMVVMRWASSPPPTPKQKALRT